MSAGNNLQEMEVSTKKSVTAVNKGARPAESRPSFDAKVEGQSGSWEDLGGPTPTENSPLGDSNKLKTPGATLKQVKNVVNKGAGSADPMPAKIVGKQASYEEVESDEELVEETEEDTEEVVVSEEEHKEEHKEEKKGEKKEEEDEEEEEEDMKEEFELNFTEDVNALIGGEDLSEEFKERAALIFESAVKAKISEIKESLENKFNKALVEEVAAIKEELTERVDSYLEYVAEEWIDENALQIENGLKGELSESFMTGLKSLFEEHYVEIPEDRYDVLENMVMRLDEMEGKLNEQIERNVQLNKRLSEAVSDTIFNDVAEGLALTQKEKLASLAESVEFEGEENYREKLEALKESYFTRATGSSRDEVLTEEATEDYGPNMNAYLRAISKFSK
jgi:hypothetical protein